MSIPAIRVSNLSKRYTLGLTHAGSIRELAARASGRLLGRKRAPLPRELAAAESNGQQVDEDGRFWALKNISFEVQPADVIGIIGGNGAGKSTVLKILSRITTPTKGRVEINGRVASLLEIGTGFHPELTGRENIFLNGAILGMTKAEIRRKFDEIVDFAGVDKFIDTPVKRYSSGMSVRLGFAVAAHLEPEILIVDEVLAVGDADFQRKCVGKMKDVSGQGRTVLFVSHNMSIIRRLCPRGVILRRGSLVFSGDINTCIEKYVGTVDAELTTSTSDRSFLFRDKSTTGRFAVTGVQMLDSNGGPKTACNTWDDLIVRVYYRVADQVDDAAVVIQIGTLEDVRLVFCATSEWSKRFCLPKGCGFVDMTLRRFPLSAGQYILGAGLAVRDTCLLCFDRARLIVENVDDCGSGFRPKPGLSFVAPDCEWDLQGIGNTAESP